MVMGEFPPRNHLTHRFRWY